MWSFILLIRAFAKALYRAVKEQPAIRGLIILTAFVLTIGTVFYDHAENWSTIDSLYFSVTTITTVGLGDLSPSTTASKIFTIVYIFVGVGILFGLVSLLVEHAIRVQKGRERGD